MFRVSVRVHHDAAIGRVKSPLVRLSSGGGIGIGIKGKRKERKVDSCKWETHTAQSLDERRTYLPVCLCGSRSTSLPSTLRQGRIRLARDRILAISTGTNIIPFTHVSLSLNCRTYLLFRACVLVACFFVCVLFLIPHWQLDLSRNRNGRQTKTTNKKNTTIHTKEATRHHTLVQHETG